MPARCTWLDDAHTIIRIDYEGNWTWDEYFKAADEARAMALSVPHRVDYITDLSRGKTPSSGSPLSNGKTVLRKLAPNSGLVVNVTSAFTAVLLNIFKQFDREMGERMMGAKSVDEAVAIIAQDRARQRTP
jgi:hypothetical protein